MGHPVDLYYALLLYTHLGIYTAELPITISLLFALKELTALVFELSAQERLFLVVFLPEDQRRHYSQEFLHIWPVIYQCSQLQIGGLYSFPGL